MTIRTKFEFSKDFFYPKSLADQDPNFDYAKFKAEPIELTSGDTILVSLDAENDLGDLIMSSTNVSINTLEDMMLVLTNQIEKTVEWTDNGYVVEVEFDDIFERAVNFFLTFTNPYMIVTKL